MHRISQSRNRLGVIWIAFALIFGALASYHLYSSTQSVPDFQVIKRPGGVLIMGLSVDAPLIDFSGQFNTYLKSQNISARNQNLGSFAGYVAALFTALFSAALEFAPRNLGTNSKTESHSTKTDAD